MKNLRIIMMLATIGSLSILMACKDGGGINELLFPVENDVELGAQVAAQIASDPNEFPVLSPGEYPEAYTYLNAMMDDILSSDDIKYRNLFAYDELKIIHRDDVLNAFATPGGYIYVYTGLIKFLDNADDLAGVLGHEVAHAELRHSVEQMKQTLGIQFLLSIVLGEGTADDIATLATNLLSLKFSRDDESDSDEYSVIYLADTDYACNGAATFFEKLVEAGNSGGPEFLSTHPAPANRVEDINSKSTELGCSTSGVQEASFTYADFKNSLPN